MPHLNSHIPCHCPCRQTSFEVNALPKVRFYCHCEVCQRVYQKPYSDFVVVWESTVKLPKQGINFNTYKKPPALQRGICESCHKPVAALLTLLPGIKIAFIPAENYCDPSQLPESSGHLFYHRRRSDSGDHLPKHNGYWASEWAVSAKIFSDLVLSR